MTLKCREQQSRDWLNVLAFAGTMTVSSRTNKFDAASGGIEWEDSIVYKPHKYPTVINRDSLNLWLSGSKC